VDVATRTALAAIVRALTDSGAIENAVVANIVRELEAGAAELVDRLGRKQDAESLVLLARAIESDCATGRRR
jgi:energy-converting hydrogenase A subunit M